MIDIAVGDRALLKHPGYTSMFEVTVTREYPTGHVLSVSDTGIVVYTEKKYLIEKIDRKIINNKQVVDYYEDFADLLG